MTNCNAGWTHGDWISLVQAVIALLALGGALYLPLWQRARDRKDEIATVKSKRAILAAAVMSEAAAIYNAIGTTGVTLNNDVYKTDANMFAKSLENISVPRSALIAAIVNELWLFGPDLGTRVARVLRHVANLDYIIIYLKMTVSGHSKP